MKYECIIWDCDGVLVDSEYLGAKLDAELFTRLGYPTTGDELNERFIGITAEELFKQIKAELGRDLREHPHYQKGLEQNRRIHDANLQSVKGVKDALEQICLPMGVASNSKEDRLHMKLEVTKLAKFFGPHVYAASRVQHGKPAPDLYLFAASQMGIQPSKCLVIEDSKTGIRAAKAAGMTVLGFVGGSHFTQVLRHDVAQEEPLRLFDDMKLLKKIIEEIECVRE